MYKRLKRDGKYQNDEFILYCDCGNRFHPLVFEVYTDIDDKENHDEHYPYSTELSIGIKEDECGFWQRLVYAFKYLCNSRKFWGYGEFSKYLERRESRNDIMALRDFLQEAAEDGVVAKNLMRRPR